VVAVLAVLIATLWPFRPFSPNGVHWIEGANGLRFEKAGLVVSNGPLMPAETDAGSYSLELLLRPASTKSSYTILAVYAPTRPKQLLVRQWTDSLLVTHDATVDRDRTRTIKFDVDHVFIPGRLAHVTISSGAGGTTVYLDGEMAGSFPEFKISRSELLGRIVLGTSPIMYQPWHGELHGLAIYAKELTAVDALRHYKEWIVPSGHPDLDGAIARYSFARGAGSEVRSQVPTGPSLEIPASFSVPYKSLLVSPAQEFKANRLYANDVAINIAGFVPLGLIVCAYLSWTRGHWRAILGTIIACGFLSFVIEVLQYYIPQRNSGTTDIITNALGAALGAVLARSSPPIRKVLEGTGLIPTDSDALSVADSSTHELG
jgi:VanZ family protein